MAVLDNINPGGMYATRVRMLGRYEQCLNLVNSPNLLHVAKTQGQG